jgi:sporulation protein YlmC with PRC-barrel domain
MKLKKYLSLSANVAIALALVGAAQTAYSADTSQSTDLQSNDKALGHVERANKIIGKTVYTSDNQKAGKVENLVVDLESGRVLFVVVGTGVLGVGGHDYAVAPGVFSEGTGDNNLRLTVDKAKLTSAPEFSSNVDKPEQLQQTSFVNQVYQHFGQTAWWQGGATASADSSAFHNVHKAKDVIGMKVKSVGNEDLGKVENLMVTLPNARVAFAILNPDSSLNLGNNFYALPPNALTWNSEQKTLVSDLNRDKLSAAPHITKDQYEMLSDPAFGSKIYQYYGKQAYFEGTARLQPTGKDSGQDYKK